MFKRTNSIFLFLVMLALHSDAASGRSLGGTLWHCEKKTTVINKGDIATIGGAASHDGFYYYFLPVAGLMEKIYDDDYEDFLRGYGMWYGSIPYLDLGFAYITNDFLAALKDNVISFPLFCASYVYVSPYVYSLVTGKMYQLAVLVDSDAPPYVQDYINDGISLIATECTLVEQEKSIGIVSDFPVRHNTRALATDGTHVWYSDGYTIYKTAAAATTDNRTVAEEKYWGGYAEDYLYSRSITFDGSRLWLLRGKAWVRETTPYVFSMDLSGRVIDSFPAPSYNPYGITWDGTNFWVSDQNDTATLFMLDKEGNIINRIAPAIPYVDYITFKEDHFWCTVSDKKVIYKLDTAGNIIDEIPTPVDCLSIAFDGEYFWCVTSDYRKIDFTICKIDTSGNVISCFAAPARTYFNGIACDGSSLWLFDGSDSVMYKLDTSGAVIDRFDIPYGYGYQDGLAYDGASFWIADRYKDMICQIDASGNIISSFPPPGRFPTAVTFDGTYLWIVDEARDLDKIYKMNTSGKILETHQSPVEAPYDLAFDGTNVWLGSETNTIYKLDTNANLLASVETPVYPASHLAFDGTCLLIPDYLKQRVYKLNLSGETIDSFSLKPDSAYDILWDGGSYWTIDNGYEKEFLCNRDAAGSRRDCYPYPGIYKYIQAMTYAHGYLWLLEATNEKGTVYKLDADYTIIDSFDTPCPAPRGLAFEEAHLWTADATEKKFYKIDTATKKAISSFDAPVSDPVGLAYDGKRFWVTQETNGDVVLLIDTSGNIIDKSYMLYDQNTQMMLEEKYNIFTYDDSWYHGMQFYNNYLWAAWEEGSNSILLQLDISSFQQ